MTPRDTHLHRLAYGIYLIKIFSIVGSYVLSHTTSAILTKRNIPTNSTLQSVQLQVHTHRYRENINQNTSSRTSSIVSHILHLYPVGTVYTAHYRYIKEGLKGSYERTYSSIHVEKPSDPNDLVGFNTKQQSVSSSLPTIRNIISKRLHEVGANCKSQFNLHFLYHSVALECDSTRRTTRYIVGNRYTSY